MSKGSRPRPFSVDANTFESNWDKIFSKKDEDIQWDHYSDLPAPKYYQNQTQGEKNEFQ